MARTTQNSATQEGASPTLAEVQAHVRKIWQRSRSNAFAHRYASERYYGLTEKYFSRQVICRIFGIICVILVYIFTATQALRFSYTEHVAVLFTFGSVVFSAFSLYFSIKQNHSGYERSFMIHNHNQHSFLYIAQRAREVSFPEINVDRAVEILEDLERDFQVLKARGQEPCDADFAAGNALLYDIASKRPEGEMQSFKMDGTNFADDNQH